MDAHQENALGEWECPSVGKNDVRRTAVRRGIKVCGHCIRPILDVAGKVVPWTVADEMRTRGMLPVMRSFKPKKGGW
jgi:ribosomal protein L37AE/L43A